MDVNKSLWGTEYGKRRGTTLLLAVVLVLVIMLTTIVYLYSNVFVRVLVKGSSMYATLEDGDVVNVNVKKKATYGDVIVIKDESQSWLIKRFIAKGGDKVMISNGYVFVNGEKLVEEYIGEEGTTYYPDCYDKNHLEFFELEVPDGEVFYLGDNRRQSSDSRNPLYGTTKEKSIVGVVSKFSIRTKSITTKIVGLGASIKGAID
jgi:signal peptidase I